ncbi:Pyridoxal-dependent decarboxylase conserved domain-containing protein [Neorhodopirellula lusitana]|uniref:Pyridoxal-dependent decarboxylase conserved domain-containing protein n=1 Tax=Neorhodopirellula lusitana TaxID=445327 RepID=A0ABY1PVK0_9BACT|nr:pyridoxal-dependent decarboxylase [Neorhodopirellula lusitana]SMP50321.1 Pyridoxal-dependent decarboxylase conserved domain-containing protein [Neorhodopirellula lusitana]
MNKELYNQVVNSFFHCDPEAITRIFNEFLTAMQAQETMPPSSGMEQNYETAQANPEIHAIPGNLKDARDAIFPYFWGTDGWSSPLHLENVKGPANYASLVGALACLLKNPNLCTDTYSQRSNELEIKAITSLANLLFYHTDDPSGVFTMGGTTSNLYGAKIGIERVAPGTMRTGLQGKKIAGIVSTASHYSNQSVAGWLGIGADNLFAIPTDEAMSMRIDLLEEQLEKLHAEGYSVAFVTATFGTTDAFGVDDVSGIRRALDEFAQRNDVTVPQLHVDAAVGWVMSFLADYDSNSNSLDFSNQMLETIQRIQVRCRGLREADSISMDFHKMGWGHYPGSALLVNRRKDLKYLARTVEDTPYFSEADERRDPALFTLECSRPALGPFSVMASLNGIGLNGWRLLAARSVDLANQLKERLEKLPYCKVLNLQTDGPHVVWWVLPKGRDAKQIYREVQAGTMKAEEYSHYTSEIQRQFDKRSKSMSPKSDARLSFTTSIGYAPKDMKIPAWKAVFFNPKTDETIIDRIIESIEDLV